MAPVGSVRNFHGLTLVRHDTPLPGDGLAQLTKLFAATKGTKGRIDVELNTSLQPSSLPKDRDLNPCFWYGKVQVYAYPDGYALYDGASYLEVDIEARKISGALHAPDTERELSSIARGMQHIALSLLLREWGWFELHAATLVSAGQGWLVLGDAGAGKTTLALALLEAGLNYLGDDRVLFEDTQPITLLSYPREFHVAARTLTAFPELSGFAGAPDGPLEKSALLPSQAFPDRHRESWCGPTRILVTRIGTQCASHWHRLPKAEVLGHLLTASAIVSVAGVRHRPRHLLGLKRLAEEAPGWELELGQDLLKTPQVVAQRIVQALQDPPP